MKKDEAMRLQFGDVVVYRGPESEDNSDGIICYVHQIRFDNQTNTLYVQVNMPSESDPVLIDHRFLEHESKQEQPVH